MSQLIVTYSAANGSPDTSAISALIIIIIIIIIIIKILVWRRYLHDLTFAVVKLFSTPN